MVFFPPGHHTPAPLESKRTFLPLTVRCPVPVLVLIELKVLSTPTLG
jgi:hypothetical protein